MKKLFRALGLVFGISMPILAGPSQPPAGNYITNVSTNATIQIFKTSSGTVTGPLSVGSLTCTGSPCGSGGGGSGPSGQINVATQNQIPRYSVSGSSNVLSGASNLTNTGSLVTISTVTVSSETATLLQVLPNGALYLDNTDNSSFSTISNSGVSGSNTLAISGSGGQVELFTPIQINGLTNTILAVNGSGILISTTVSGGGGVSSSSGSIVQIVSSNTVSISTIAGTSFADTYLGATITPKSTSDIILIHVTGQLENIGPQTATATLSRGEANLLTTSGACSQGVLSQPTACPMVWVDAGPLTAGATTYRVQVSTGIWGATNQTQSMVLEEINPTGTASTGTSLLFSTNTWTGGNTFTSSVTVSGAGNGKIGLNISGSTYTVTSSSVVPVTANYVMWSSTNGTLMNGGVAGAGVTAASTTTWTGSNTYTNAVNISSNLYVSNNGSHNAASSMVDVYKNGAASSDVLFSVGSSNQVSQLAVKDQQPLDLEFFGARAGNLFMGLSTGLNQITSNQNANKWELYNAGNMIFTTDNDATNDFIFKPRGTEQLRVSSLSGMTVASPMTVTSSATFNGTVAVSSGFIAGGSAGTSGQFLKSNGAGTVPSWATASGGGGASLLAVTTGSSSGFSAITTSPTAVVSFDSTTFNVTLAGSATAYTSLNSNVATSGKNWTAGAHSYDFTGASSVLLPSPWVATNVANTYTAGKVQTFQASASSAALNFGASADPSGPSGSDMWGTLAGYPRWYDGTNVHQFTSLMGSGTTEPTNPSNGTVAEWGPNATLTSSSLIVNVMSYGCAGNGSTDDSGCFQAALNAAKTAGNGTIYIPAHTYYLHTFNGPNSATDVLGISDYGSNWSINLACQGGAVLETDQVGTNSSTPSNLFDFQGGWSNSSISDCYMINTHSTSANPQTAIYMGGGGSQLVQGNKLTGNTFSSFSRAVIATGVTNLKVDKNTFLMPSGHDSGTTGSDPNVGLWLANTAPNGVAKDVIVSNNFYDGCSNGTAGTTTHSCGDGFLYGEVTSGQFTGNIVKHFDYEAEFIYANSSGTAAGTPIDDNGGKVFSNNVINGYRAAGDTNNGTNYGIRADASNTLVSGNNITNVGYGIIGTYGSGSLEPLNSYGDNIKVENNSIVLSTFTFTYSGIYEAGFRNTNIIGNTIIGSNTIVTNGEMDTILASGLNVSTPGANGSATIRDNKVSFASVPSSATVGVFAQWITNVDIRGNTLLNANTCYSLVNEDVMSPIITVSENTRSCTVPLKLTGTSQSNVSITDIGSTAFTSGQVPVWNSTSNNFLPGTAGGSPANYYVNGSSVGIGPVSFVSSGTLNVFDNGTNPGITTFQIQRGINQGSTDLMSVTDSGGGANQIFEITGNNLLRTSGSINVGYSSGVSPLVLSPGTGSGPQIGNQLMYQFVNGAFPTATGPDTGLGRNGAGIVEVDNAVLGQYGGFVSANDKIISSTTAWTYSLTASTASAGPYYVDISTTGHLNSQAVSGSTVTSCGAGASLVGSDIAGIITTGSASPTACTLTFARPYTNTPVCLCGANGATACDPTSTSATAVTFTLSVTQTSIKYICIGRD